jgi:hypothetical protein
MRARRADAAAGEANKEGLGTSCDYQLGSLSGLGAVWTPSDAAVGHAEMCPCPCSAARHGGWRSRHMGRVLLMPCTRDT